MEVWEKEVKRMTVEELAVLADDIADMAWAYVDAKDAKSLHNAAKNLANMIRIHVKDSKEPA